MSNSLEADEIRQELIERDYKQIFRALGFELNGESPNSDGWISKLHGPKQLGEGRKGNFSVNVQHGGVRDHGDEGYSGDVFQAVMGVKGMNFQEALQWTADKAGMETTERTEWKAWEGQTVKEYHYHDEDRNYRFTQVRKEPPADLEAPKRSKQFLSKVDGEGIGLHGHDKIPYRLPDFSAKLKEGPDYVTYHEGEKDVDNVREVGIPATTTPFGANSFDPEVAVPHFEGLHVAIFPDNDSEGKNHAKKVAEALYRTAESVKIVRLEGRPPEGGDVSDWIERKREKGYGSDKIREKLHERIEATPEWEPSTGGRHTNGQAADKATEGDADPWSDIRSLYDGDKPEARLQAAEQAIEDHHFATRRENGRLYHYDDEEGVYKGGGPQILQNLLVRKLRVKHSRHEQKEIENKIKALTYRSRFGGEFVPVANGDLFLNPIELKDADPGRAPFHRSPARWAPDADCPRFAEHLMKVVPTREERETLQEYVGYCLLHWGIPHHKALFMVGPTASGKSTTLTVIRKLLGKVSKVSPQQLVNGRFGTSELEGAWANIRSDISNSVLKDIGKFKEIVGGDPIYVERKFEQGYSLRPTAKHLYSANELPEASVDDAAFYRRILLVSFPRTIPREERVNRAELDAELEAELDGVLQWAVQGLQRVMEQDGFTHDLSPADTQRRWDEHSSSIGRFKTSALRVTGENDHVEAKQEVYSAYTDFCDDQGLSTETQQQLTRTLKRDSRIGDADRTPAHHDSQTSCYVGLQIRPDWHPEGDEVPF